MPNSRSSCLSQVERVSASVLSELRIISIHRIIFRFISLPSLRQEGRHVEKDVHDAQVNDRACYDPVRLMKSLHGLERKRLNCKKYCYISLHRLIKDVHCDNDD